MIITDNGHGMSPQNLPLACTRFATSKLVSVNDLKSISTFGFRGEALASASMVAHVSIVSRVRKNKGGEDIVESDADDNDNDDDNGTKYQQQHNCAYKMQYKDGGPNAQTNPNSSPKPSAGREGTVITVQDLFYNIPSRRRALESGGRRSERDEYDRILNVVQRYAVHEAKRGVGFSCRGGGGGGSIKTKNGFSSSGGNHTDLNTQSLASVKRLQERRKRSTMLPQQQQKPSSDEQFAATKDVISHIFGVAVTRELLPLSASEGDVEAVSLLALKAMEQKNNAAGPSVTTTDEVSNEGSQEASNAKSNEFNISLIDEMMIGGADCNTAHSNSKKPHDSTTEDVSATTTSSKFSFAFRASGLITNGAYSTPKSSSAFLLFINDRLVDSSYIRRAVENVYSETLPKGGKPFVYLSLELPGPHVDVNVHPTKREVAFLHEDRLCDALSKVIRDVISGATSSRTFSVANGGRLMPQEKGDEGKSEISRSRMQQLRQGVGNSDDGATPLDATLKQSKEAGKENNVNSEPAETVSVDVAPKESSKEEEQPKSDTKMPKKRSAETKESAPSKRSYDPSRLVRTSRTLPAGALEPFLIQKEAKELSQTKNDNADASSVVKHKPDCPLANATGQQIDMAIPGAFASAICRCQVERAESLPPASNGIVVRATPPIMVPREKRIAPTECDYESIINLRNEFTDLNHQKLNEILRGATYVGAVSRSRSLIQYGIDLHMINHEALACEMFYQIALLKFKGLPMAKLGEGGVDVISVISQTLQFEEDLARRGAAELRTTVISVNKTNVNLARQATSCLEEKAPMLEEYFSIKLEKMQVYNKEKQRVTSLRITGLPILLDGHSPQPHGLPLFLLRLATEVDWSDEEPCFKGICRELASYYSELPYAFNNVVDADNTDDDDNDDANKQRHDLIDDVAKQHVKHTLFPAISYLLVPPKKFADNEDVVKLANLNSLYKVFERC